MAGDFVAAVAAVRDAVCALLRIAPTQVAGQFQLWIVGTGWCVVPDRYFVTAHHVFNDGKARDPNDKFYLLRAPNNGHVLQFWKVTGFTLEDAGRDLAIIEAPPGGNFAVPAIPVTATPPPDGARVLTYGAPAPQIAGAQLVQNGDLVTIQTLLFTHANEGIVAAKYDAPASTDTLFEFSVAWHHGESGGPVVRMTEPFAAFAVMQHYRNIQGPNGVMAGPRRGLALASITNELARIGANLVR